MMNNVTQFYTLIGQYTTGLVLGTFAAHFIFTLGMNIYRHINFFRLGKK